MEICKDIKGYEGLYTITSNGVVESTLRNGTLGGILKYSYTQKNYARVRLYKNNISIWHSIHRLLAETFIPNSNNYPYVCHKDGNPRNNSLENLYWGTAKMNSSDTLRHGTRLLGIKHWKAHLTEEQVKEIRFLSDTHKKSYSKLSKLYGVSKSHIGLIVQRKSWAYLK